MCSGCKPSLPLPEGFPAVPKHWGCAAAFGDTEQSLRLQSGVSWLCVCGRTGDGMMVFTLLRLAGWIFGGRKQQEEQGMGMQVVAVSPGWDVPLDWLCWIAK